MLEESVAIGYDLGTRTFFATANQILGWDETNLGLHEAARDHYQVALALYEEMDYRPGIAGSLHGLGQMALVREAYAEAQQWLEQSVAFYKEAGQRQDEGLVLAILGRAALGLDRLPQARQHLHQALQAATETGTWSPLMASLPSIALLLDRQGQPERAVELYALASRYPYVGNSRFWEDVAGRHIAAVAATLPADIAAAAQERGRARDLSATVAELLVELGRGSRGSETPG